MKTRKRIILFGCVLLLGLLASEWLYAMSPEPTENEVGSIKLFVWADGNSPNYLQGFLFGLMGIVGALTSIFSFIGKTVPGTGGRLHIEKEELRLARMNEKFEKFNTAQPTVDAEYLKEIRLHIDSATKRLNRNKTSQFMLSSVLFIVLGCFFSLMIAQDLLQALIIGAGWTGILGSFGLKQDYKERNTLKNNVLEAAENTMRAYHRQAAEDEKQISPDSPATPETPLSPPTSKGVARPLADEEVIPKPKMRGASRFIDEERESLMQVGDQGLSDLIARIKEARQL